MNMISLLGFDITHIMLSITSLDMKPARIIALIAKFGESIDPRSINAINTLRQICSYMSIPLSEAYINVLDIEHSINTIKHLLYENTPLILDIGGGPRIMVIETLLAYLSLPNDRKKLIDMTIYLEGRNQVKRVSYNQIVKILTPPRPIELTYYERLILDILRKYGTLRLAVLWDIMKNKYNVQMSKQNILRILDKLRSKNLVDKISRGLYRAL